MGAVKVRKKLYAHQVRLEGRSMTGKGKEIDRLSRRSLVLGLGGTLAAIASFKRAHGMDFGERIYNYDFKKDFDFKDVIPISGLHEGKGVVDVKFFFGEDDSPMPALLLTYALPPGASEGVHTHRPGDAKEGSYDEFYYIIEGEGVMEINGEPVAVSAGDNIFTPNEVAHGIENTSEDKLLKVYLIAMTRP